jgi:ribose transport system substrate-binding protein
MREIQRFLGLLITALALVACSPKSDGIVKSAPSGGAAAAAKVSKKLIGLSVLTLTNPFFKVIADSMTEEAAKHGYEVIVVSGEIDVARQQNQIKDFIVKRVAAIVLTPCDSKSIGPAIQEANAAGIPVFTADIACMAPGPKVITHVATDNYGGGREAADAMIEVLHGRGKVAIVDYPEIESVIQRTRGFEARIAEANKDPDIEIEIVAKLPGQGARDRGFKAAQDLLQSHPDISGIFAINDPSALGVRAALENAGKADQIKIVGFDGQPEAKQAIKEGKIHASPIQFPEKIGVETMRVIVKHFNGEQVPREVLIPTSLYRQADGLADPTLK